MDDPDAERLTLRCRRLNGAPFRTRGADYVLCWLQQALRGRSNPAIDAAIALGMRLDLPVVVYHGLGRHYPHASARLHRFILEASHDLERDVVARGLRFLRHVERDGKIEKGLVYRLAEWSLDREDHVDAEQVLRVALQALHLVVHVVAHGARHFDMVAGNGKVHSHLLTGEERPEHRVRWPARLDPGRFVRALDGVFLVFVAPVSAPVAQALTVRRGRGRRRARGHLYKKRVSPPSARRAAGQLIRLRSLEGGMAMDSRYLATVRRAT